MGGRRIGRHPAPHGLLAAGCGHWNGSGGGGPGEPSAPVALTLTPDQTSLALGTGKKFKAVAWYPDGSTVDVSSEVVWSE